MVSIFFQDLLKAISNQDINLSNSFNHFSKVVLNCFSSVNTTSNISSFFSNI